MAKIIVALCVIFPFYFMRMQTISKVSVQPAVFTSLLKEFFINLFGAILHKKALHIH